MAPDFGSGIGKCIYGFGSRHRFDFRPYPNFVQFRSSLQESESPEDGVPKARVKITFWEMLEVIYASRPTPAADIPTPKELDAQELQSCLQNLETLPKIRQQAKEAQAIGLNGTPSIYILDTQTGEFGFIDGSTSSQNLQMVFDQLKTPSEDESI